MSWNAWIGRQLFRLAAYLVANRKSIEALHHRLHRELAEPAPKLPLEDVNKAANLILQMVDEHIQQQIFKAGMNPDFKQEKNENREKLELYKCWQFDLRHTCRQQFELIKKIEQVLFSRTTTHSEGAQLYALYAQICYRLPAEYIAHFRRSYITVVMTGASDLTEIDVAQVLDACPALWLIPFIQQAWSRRLLQQ